MVTDNTKERQFTTLTRKFIVALSGLALLVFVIVHLLGNLTLFASDPNVFNKYAHKLTSLGPILIVAEVLLLAAFLVHALLAVKVYRENKQARPIGYQRTANAGGASKKTISSTTMILTGLVIFIFVILHVKTFKFGPGIAEGYGVNLHGEPVRDLYRLVREVFQQEGYVMGYVAAMLFLGFHLRHAFWSAFQSLSINYPRYSNLIYSLGVLLAILLTLGYVALPIWMYFTGKCAIACAGGTPCP